MRRLFLDCDQVLADFNGYVEKIIGVSPRMASALYGEKGFLDILRFHQNFFLNLPMLPDAQHLFNVVKHLNPVILTGCPPGGWAEPQKQAWAAKRFPQTQMICCKAEDKCLYAQPGDVLVDDWPKARHLWETAGGIFILHENADTSISQVLNLFKKAA